MCFVRRKLAKIFCCDFPSVAILRARYNSLIRVVLCFIWSGTLHAGLSFGDVMSTGSSGRLFCVPVVLSGPVSGVKDAKSK